jgi:hypothetical protein
VCEHDAADRAKRAGSLVVDEILILSINIRCSDVVDPNEPVERSRVILPDNSRQVQRMRNKPNPVLCQEKI